MDVRFMHLATVAAQELSSSSPCLRRTQSLYMHTLGLLIEICSLSLVAYHVLNDKNCSYNNFIGLFGFDG